MISFEADRSNLEIWADWQVKELRTALGVLSERSSQYASDACLRRYLRARNWNLKKAEKMLRESLEWRETYKPQEISWVSTGINYLHVSDFLLPYISMPNCKLR